MINDLMIKSFLTVAETLNFTNAAKQLYLSQQAVSKHIAKLEEVLDCQLFLRKRGNISLTPAGKIYFKVFAEYDKNMTDAQLLVRSLLRNDQRKLVIAHLELLDISSLLSPITKRFNELYPNVILEYKSCPDWELPMLLKDDKVDLVITFNCEMEFDEQHHIRHLFLERVPELLFISKEHPLATDDAKLSDFTHENVFFSLPPSGNVSSLLARMDLYGFPYENLICTDNLLSSCTAIDMMQGISFAIEHSKILTRENYRTYPTKNEVDIIACYRENSPKKELQQFCHIISELQPQENYIPRPLP
jgi:DNA-binding transcriptional LysR family regulator